MVGPGIVPAFLGKDHLMTKLTDTQLVILTRLRRFGYGKVENRNS